MALRFCESAWGLRRWRCFRRHGNRLTERLGARSPGWACFGLRFRLSMFPFAEQRVSSALTGMLNGANPLFATLVACLIARRAPSRGVTVGLAVGSEWRSDYGATRDG